MAPYSGTISVLGLGTTGAALTAVLAANGYRVDTVEPDSDALWHGRNRVRAAIAALGLPDREQADGRVNYTTGSTLLPRADVVIEAVPERLSCKAEVLRHVDTVCPKRTLFVTVTSGLSVTDIAARSGRMARTVGLHLCHPGQLTDGTVAEVVLTPVTEAAAQAELAELVRRIGKTPVCVVDRPGLLGAGLLLGYLNSAAVMYEQRYASRDDIDVAMTHGCGLRVGPLAQLDAMGLDTVLDSLRALADRTGDPCYTPATVLTRMVEAGLLGRKSGRGFYTYDTDTTPESTADDGTSGGRTVRTVGIAGSGTMAAGIAEVFARAGYPTTVAARDDLRAKSALSTVEASMARAVSRGKLTGDDLDRAMTHLCGANDLSALADADLVIEAVAEDLTTKRAIFAVLDKVTRPDAVLATTTSSLPVIELATATSRPDAVVGMHFFNPAPVMKLVEVSHTLLTADDAVATALAVTRALGKRPVRCGDRTGFIVNALLFPYLNRAVNLAHERNIDLDTVDSVLAGGYGYPVGPFQLLDTIGLDVSLAIQERLHEAYGTPGLAPARHLSDLVTAGYLGRKTGRGFRSHMP